AAVAEAAHVSALGIDAEPNLPLPPGVLEMVALPCERTMLRTLGSEVHWGRLLFSAKEAVYKAWFPLMRCCLGLEDVVIAIENLRGSFEARLLVQVSGGPAPIGTLHGHWGVHRDVIGTAVELSKNRGK